MRKCWLGLAALLPLFGSGEATAQSARLQELEAKKVQGMNRAELGEFLTLKRQEDASRPLNERTAEMAKLATGQSFKLGAPLYGVQSSDCMTFVMQSIARATARNLPEHDAILKRLNYKNGSGDYLDTIPFTEDWIESGMVWIWDDVTSELGAEVSTYQARLLYRARLKALDYGQHKPGKDGKPAENDNEVGRRKAEQHAQAVANAQSDRTVTVSYLPKEALENEAVAEQIQDGDIILVVRQRRAAGKAPWYEISHMGIANWNEIDQLCLVHSSAPEVKSQLLGEHLDKNSSLVGIKVLRLKRGL